jgi:hypothetical protein
MSKHVARANSKDNVSVISNLTDKTLKAATTMMGGTQLHHVDDSSTISGMTSKSKMQLAVKEALKGVSEEHNKAMMEQQQHFQREIDALRHCKTILESVMQRNRSPPRPWKHPLQMR